MSEEQELFQRQYEEAAFKVYGTPPRKTSFQVAARKEGEQKD